MSTSAPCCSSAEAVCGEGCAVLESHGSCAPELTTVRVQLHEQHGSLHIMIEQSSDLGHPNKVLVVLDASTEWSTEFYAEILARLSALFVKEAAAARAVEALMTPLLIT
ncbi:hypothetical protein FOA52_003291 [Chlamydomonas sp. UWO 241]|nr:hypothetical protein FOA52_003291 [Chlamydomonas sp. UWO 241]